MRGGNGVADEVPPLLCDSAARALWVYGSYADAGGRRDGRDGASRRRNRGAGRRGRIGKEARLPPHLVEVLGLGTHVGGLAVRQLALRQGSVVRTFNVSAESALDVVIFDYDEASRATLVCLLTPAAKLRRAVTYVAGDAPHLLAKPEARRRFGPELDYWLAIRLSASPASR